MTKQKQKRKLIDWDSVEPLFRAGSLSNCDICRRYAADHVNSQVWKITVAESAIRKQAKLKNWQKNLADKVKNQIKENLVRNEVRGSHQKLSDNEIVEKVAEAGSNVVIRHRKEIVALLKHEDELLTELAGNPKKLYLSTFQGTIIEKKVGLTVTEKSITLKNLAAVRAQRITLERQAHSLDDVSPDKRSGDEVTTPNEVLRRLAFLFRNNKEECQGG